MQNLKDKTDDFVNLVLQASDGALNEFLSIVEKAECTEITVKIAEILKHEIEYRKNTKNNK